MTDNQSDIDTAQKALSIEIEGLKALSDSIDESFSRAIETIQAMKEGRQGRLIVAGIGKSGHIAKKIVATLASTGTPSHFIHAGEASHGDMGMIMESDVVLMISNSGENPELSDMIAYTRRFDIPLICITSNAESALASHSDIKLIMPKMPEACPNGLAPTTSTTMTLAYGDAIAVALLERMKLTPEQFSVFHPGGKLGQKLVSVREIMTPKEDLPMIPLGTKMDAAIVEMTAKNLGCVLIMDDADQLAGIVTDGDLKRHMAPDLLGRETGDLMNVAPKTICQDALAAEAMQIMTKTPGQYITSLIATDADGRLTGLIRLQDCLQRGIV